MVSQRLLFSIELEDFLVVLGQRVKDDLESTVQIIDESLVVCRLSDDWHDHDTTYLSKCFLGAMHQCLNGWFLGLGC